MKLNNTKKIYLNWACAGVPTNFTVTSEDTYTFKQRAFISSPLKSLKHLESACNKSFIYLSKNLNCDIDSLVLSTGSTHSLQMFFQYNNLSQNINTVTTNLEFPTVLKTLQFHSSDLQVIDLLNVKSNEQIFTLLKENLTKKTNLILISHVSYLTGQVLPIEKLVTIIRQISPKAFILIDGSQAVGQIPVSLKFIDFDLYFFSTDKWINGPSVGVSVFKNSSLRNYFLEYSPSPFSIYNREGKHSKSGVSASSVAAISSVNFKSFKQMLKVKNRILNLRQIFINQLQQNLLNFEIDDSHLNVSGIVSIELQAITKDEIKKLYNSILKARIIFSVVDYAYPKGINIPGKNIFRFSIHSNTKKEELIQAAFTIANKLRRYKVKLL